MKSYNELLNEGFFGNVKSKIEKKTLSKIFNKKEVLEIKNNIDELKENSKILEEGSFAAADSFKTIAEILDIFNNNLIKLIDKLE